MNPPDAPRRILVLSLAGIGDTLMATPLLAELRRRFPPARIDVLVLWAGSAQILQGNPNVDTVLRHDFLKAPRTASLRYVLGLRGNRYDLSLTLHPQGRREYRIITRLIGARVRLSHRYENASPIDRCLVTHTLPQDYTVSCLENNLRLLTLIGGECPMPAAGYELFLDPAEEAWAQEWLRANGLAGRRWLGVHVGSGGTKNLALRRWPVDCHARLFRELAVRRPDLPVVLFGGPDEREAHARLQSEPGLVLHFPATPGLRHAAALLRSATGFLSVDTAFMHLAAWARVPRQVVIETPTLNPPVEPARPDWIRVPNPGVGGRPLDFYRYDGRPIAGSDAEIEAIMRSVTVDAVLEALEGI